MTKQYPVIPKEVDREIWKFFLKTSVPRLIAEKKRKEVEK